MVADDMFKIVESAYGKVNIIYNVLSSQFDNDFALNNEVNQCMLSLQIRVCKLPYPFLARVSQFRNVSN